MAQLYHPGSWNIGNYRLPDFGISERVGSLLGSPSTHQGGSNVFNNVSPGASYPVDSIPSFQNSGAQTNQATGGSILGTTSSFGGTGSLPTNTVPSDNNQNTGPDINSLLDQAYVGAYQSLSDQEGTLASSKASQEGQLQNTFNQSSATLKQNRDTGLSDIDTQQTKSLNDLTDSLQGYWRQGNALLGTRGASDSSASNMYSYALAKLGSKQRGGLIEEFSRRRGALEQTYGQGLAQLQTQFQNQMMAINDWFQQSQAQLRAARSGLDSQKSQQVLQYALDRVQEARQSYQNQLANVQQWALNHSNTLQQLEGYMSKYSQGLPTAQPLFGNIQGGISQSNQMPGYGNMFAQEETKPLFS